ncbi:hypothetical protein PG988_013444 [Apiospora saccharicola]
MFSYEFCYTAERRGNALTQTRDETNTHAGPIELGRQYLTVPQPETSLTRRTHRPPIDGSLNESEANTNNGTCVTSPSRPATSRHISIPRPEELPHRTSYPTNQKQGDESRCRVPSPYPSSRGLVTPCQTLRVVITKSQPPSSPRPEGQIPTLHAVFPQAEELPHKTPSTSCPIAWSNVQPTNQKQFIPRRDKSSSLSSSGRRSRAPSPYPGCRGRQESIISSRQSSCSPKPDGSGLLRHVSFPQLDELPHKTQAPVRPTNQKQSKSSVSSSSSSSSSSSDRSRAPSPYPLSRAHRKEILQELEAYRTGHRNGIYRSTTVMKDNVPDIPAGPDRAALPFMNPQPSLINLRSSNTRDAATSMTEDGQVQQPAKQHQEQRSFQEFWDSFEDFNEHRYYPDGETRPEYKESASENQQDINKVWETFEDVEVDHIPQCHYDAESTESRRRGRWFSRWFGSGRRH